LFDVSNPGAGLFDYIQYATIGSVQEDSDGVIVLAAQGPDFDHARADDGALYRRL